MTSTLTIRVNPNKQGDMAVNMMDGSSEPYARIGVMEPGVWRWMTDAAVEDWSELQLQVPVVKRKFQHGDVVVVSLSRLIRLGSAWYYVVSYDYFGRDSRVWDSGYSYVGNIASMVAPA